MTTYRRALTWYTKQDWEDYAVRAAWDKYRKDAHAEWHSNRPWIDFGDMWTDVALAYWHESIVWDDAVRHAKEKALWMQA